MEKYTMTLNNHYWECGDGCCSGEDLTVFVNDIEIGTYADMYLDHQESLTRFLTCINENENDLVLSFTVDVDEEGDIEEAIYLNDVKITNTYSESCVYTDILDRLVIPYQHRTYDLDWEIWREEKRLVLFSDDE